MKVLALTLITLALALGAFAQNAPIPTQTFSFNAAPIDLPGSKGTFVGTDAGLTFSPTPNLDAAEHNIVSSDGRLSSFLGGVNYRFPAVSLKANNLMPGVSGFRMLFGLGASVGIDRVKDASGVVQQHYAALAQATFSYALTTSGNWQWGANVGLARFPGYAKGWTPVLEVGPQFHF
jgi:hypothetical protein